MIKALPLAGGVIILVLGYQLACVGRVWEDWGMFIRDWTHDVALAA